MNVSLRRLLEGIIATLRTSVIPHVADPYARGQAVGVIDVVNNIIPQAQWTREPMLTALREKSALLERAASSLPDLARIVSVKTAAELSSAELEAELARFDAAIANAIALAHRAGNTDLLKSLVAHLHDELGREMALTRKPLFAEIASGRDEKEKHRQ